MSCASHWESLFEITRYFRICENFRLLSEIAYPPNIIIVSALTMCRPTSHIFFSVMMCIICQLPLCVSSYCIEVLFANVSYPTVYMYLLVNVQQFGPLTAWLSCGRAYCHLVVRLKDSHCLRSVPFRDPPMM